MYYGQSLEDTAEVARARREFLQVFDAATKGLIKTIDNLYIEGPKFIIKSNREVPGVPEKMCFPIHLLEPIPHHLILPDDQQSFNAEKVNTQLLLAGHFLTTS